MAQLKSTRIFGTIKSFALTQSTSVDTGALVVSGGVGIGKNITVGGNATITGNENISGTLAVTGAITGAKFNKLTITPATGSTLTIAEGKTLIVNRSLTLSSGTDGKTMTFPSADDDIMGLGAIQTVSGAKTFNNGKLIIAGTTGTTVLNASATATGTLVFPAVLVEDTLVGRETIDTLTNKTLTSPIVNDIKAFATSTDADLWSEITTGSINIGAGLTTGTLNLDTASTNTHAVNLGTGATATAKTKTVNIGTGGLSGSTANIKIGNGLGKEIVTIGNTVGATAVNIKSGTGKVNIAGDTDLSSTTDSSSTTTGALKVAGGVGIVKDLNVGEDLNVGKDLTVAGNLTINGTTTTINATKLDVADKNITLGTEATTDFDAEGGGITLKGGLSDKTIIWKKDTNSWSFNQNIDILSGGLKINGTEVINSLRQWTGGVSGTLAGAIGTLSGTITTVASGATITTVASGATITNINSGVLLTNHTGTIGTNSGTITTNSGTITTNTGGISTVASGATITTVASGATITNINSGVNFTNHTGTIGTNSGAITSNTGTIGTNSGAITSNTGAITTNNGTISTVASGATISTVASGATISNINAGVNVGTIANATNVTSCTNLTSFPTESLTFATDGSLKTTSTGTLTLDSGTTGAIDIGRGDNAKIITIGNINTTTAVNIKSGTGKVNITGGLTVSGTVQTWNQDTTGNATTATALESEITIWGNSFDGSGNVTGDLELGDKTLTYVSSTAGAYKGSIEIGKTGGDVNTGPQIKISCNQSGTDKAKYLRVNTSGSLELVNNAYNAVVMSVTDSGDLTANKVYNAVWNDIADFLEVDEDIDIEYGKAYFRDNNGKVRKTNKRNSYSIGIASDTFGFGVGRKDENIKQIPIAIGGWVLACVDNIYKAGTALIATEDGTLTKASLLTKSFYPERIIAVFDREEKEEFWNKIKVDSRCWVKVK